MAKIVTKGSKPDYLPLSVNSSWSETVVSTKNFFVFSNYGVEKPRCNMTNTKRVLKPRMTRAWINVVSPRKLFYAPQSLKRL